MPANGLGVNHYDIRSWASFYNRFCVQINNEFACFLFFENRCRNRRAAYRLKKFGNAMLFKKVKMIVLFFKLFGREFFISFLTRDFEFVINIK